MEFVSVFLAFVFFFLPTFIAIHRGHASTLAIALCNALFGITVIGWVWCLIWALANKGAQQNVTINNNITK